MSKQRTEIKKVLYCKMKNDLFVMGLSLSLRLLLSLSLSLTGA